MASVHLDDLWLHLADDLSIYLTLPLDGQVEERDLTVERRRYAGGRDRMIVRPGAGTLLQVRTDLVSVDDVDTLRSWTGLELLFRDPLRRHEYGFFSVLAVEQLPGTDLANVSFTFETITRAVFL